MQANNTCVRMQVGTLLNGTTGVFEIVGNGWQATSLSRSLKWVATESVAVSEESVRSGTLMLPLRLGYIGHEGTCQRLADFQQTRAVMLDSVMQVRDCFAVCSQTACMFQLGSTHGLH
jgi:hypothetical protein